MADLSMNTTHIAYFIAGIVVTLLLFAKVCWRSELDAIPTVGSSSWLGSWQHGFRYRTNGGDLIRQGYAKYKHRPFKVADHYRWLVIVSSREHMEEIRTAGEDQFSLDEAFRERMSTDYMLGKEVHANPYHMAILRLQLTRNIGALSLEIRDEIVCAFNDVLDLINDEWKSVPTLTVIQKVVFRVSNRVFVGLPLCRDPGWMDFNIQNGHDVVNGAYFLQRFPSFLSPVIAPFIKNAHHSIEHGMKYLGPLIAKRRRSLDKYGDEWVDKPNDFLSWMMDVAEGEECKAELLTARMLASILAALHTTSNNLTSALFYLAANPQYVQPLREEVEGIINREGWSKAAVDKMRKIDSFLKENQRMRRTGSESLSRKAMKDFTFSDGMHIPKGTLISAAAGGLHTDDELYENAALFDPFRFARMREAVGESSKHQFATTSLDYLAFGHGRSACPGRFLAVHQLKALLAHIVVSYDVKLEENTTIPQYVTTSINADPNTKVMFKRRS